MPGRHWQGTHTSTLHLGLLRGCLWRPGLLQRTVAGSWCLECGPLRPLPSFPPGVRFCPLRGAEGKRGLLLLPTAAAAVHQVLVARTTGICHSTRLEPTNPKWDLQGHRRDVAGVCSLQKPQQWCLSWPPPAPQLPLVPGLCPDSIPAPGSVLKSPSLTMALPPPLTRTLPGHLPPG